MSKMKKKKRGKKREVKEKKKLIILGSVVIALVVILLIVFIKPTATGNTVANPEYRYVPLSQSEIERVATTILSSEFIKDVPKKNPVAITFFNFDEQGKYWQDGFLIGKDKLLSEGEPSIYLALHSKYISGLDGTNLCDIIKQANNNGDLAFDSQYGKAKLLVKYAGMLKHRDCFGF